MAFEILTADEVCKRLQGRKYKYAQVHHTWRPDYNDFNGKNHLSIQEGMRSYHVNTRGWTDIGQHLTSFPDGKFVTGRNWGTIPAGISGYNTGSFMIENLGDFDAGQDKITKEQLEAITQVYNCLVEDCGATLMYHHEHAAKSCPGTGFMPKAQFDAMVRKWDDLHLVEYKPFAPNPVHKTASVLLKFGDRTEAVKIMQKKLHALGYDTNGVDGIFGPGTKGAVKEFQKDKKLVVDGLAGPSTLSALDKAAAYPGKLLKNGSRGADVKVLQRALGVSADGIFGPKTEEAVRAFQGANRLGVDGIAGPKTWAKLF